MTQKEILLAYFYNNRCRLEEEVKQLQLNLRFRKVDITDCFELICAIQRLETFSEVTRHVMALLII